MPGKERKRKRRRRRREREKKEKEKEKEKRKSEQKREKKRRRKEKKRRKEEKKKRKVKKNALINESLFELRGRVNMHVHGSVQQAVGGMGAGGGRADRGRCISLAISSPRIQSNRN